MCDAYKFKLLVLLVLMMIVATIKCARESFTLSCYLDFSFYRTNFC